jgi:hypothetical protein
MYMVEIPVRALGSLGVFGVVGVWTNEPALFGLFALFARLGVDRTVDVPRPGETISADSCV